MTFKHLRYFVAVAEELNFSRAAVRLDISRSAISRQIKDLEKELDTALLFWDNHKAARLTPAGRAFLVYAQDILNRTAQIPKKMKSFLQSDAGGHFSHNHRTNN